jgi:hypothetical protein
VKFGIFIFGDNHPGLRRSNKTYYEVAEEIFREYETIGVTHVICLVNFGGTPMGDMRRTMEMISKELMPKLP